MLLALLAGCGGGAAQDAAPSGPGPSTTGGASSETAPQDRCPTDCRRPIAARTSVQQAAACLSRSTTKAQHYASPSGTASGDGSLEHPWDLTTAFARPPSLEAGDVLWLRGGTYAGFFTTTLRGTASAPIIVCAYAGERATLTNGPIDTSVESVPDTLTIAGINTWFWGLEVTSGGPTVNRTVSTDAEGNTSWPTSTELPMGGDVSILNDDTASLPGIKLINMVIHDGRQGVSYWMAAQSSEINGTLIYHMGWDNTLDRGHGHAMYAQNKIGDRKIYDNIVFGGFADGIDTYGTSAAYLNDLDIEGNTVFNIGALSAVSGGSDMQIGGGAPLVDPIVKDNMIYEPNIGSWSLGYTFGATNNSGGVMTGNYVMANTYVLFFDSLAVDENTFIGGLDTQMHLTVAAGQSPASYHWDDNQYRRIQTQWDPFAVEAGGATTAYDLAGWQAATDLDPHSTYSDAKPPTNHVVVRPNTYEKGRSNVTIFNWEGLSTVSVDLSATGLATGQSYLVKDAQDFFGPPIFEGSYDGGTIAIPMTGVTAAQPIGIVPKAYVHTSSAFGAFVVLPR